MAFYDRELKDNEELIRVVRSYPLSYVSRLTIPLLILLAPFFFAMPLFKLGPLGYGIFVVLLTVGLVTVIRVLVMAHFNCFLITSRRVVDWDQRGLFDRVVSEAEYSSIEDVSYRVKGILGTTLDYGSVQIQTAAGVVTLELPNARHPRKLQSLITDIKNKHA